MPDCFGCTCSPNACAFYHRTRGYGCNRHPAFPAPSLSSRGQASIIRARFAPRQCGRLPRSFFDILNPECGCNGSAPPLPLAGEGWGGGVSASHTARAERASPTRIASFDAMRPPPQAGEVTQEGYRPLNSGLRFSLNAAMPSRRSSVPTSWLYASTSKNIAERRSIR
jgi:hypothetical protein